MTVLKRLPKLLFGLFIIALLLCPLGLIYQISQAEMEQYTVPVLPKLIETSYGDVVQVLRGDMGETISVSGTFVSRSYAYQDLKYGDKNSSIRWQVGPGDEVCEGYTLGSYANNDIVAQYTGLVDSIYSYSTDGYICYRLFSPVELECSVDDATLTVLKRSSLELSLLDGTPVEITFLSSMKNVDGSTKVRFSIESESYQYGTFVEDLLMLTGRTFSQALMVRSDAVYQKVEGDNEPWYARVVSEDGVFIKEIEVKVSYSSGDMVCISGEEVEEGAFFDAGYKAVIEGV